MKIANKLVFILIINLTTQLWYLTIKSLFNIIPIFTEKLKTTDMNYL